ncbi:MAG: hypothetical protein DWH99_06210 [Planctomycetota bacterium]|nr:MAG: hypothetical protein DWH99_06210 [Planctomycetota bacterium]
MERTPSAGSLSGNFLGSGRFDTFGSSTMFGSSAFGSSAFGLSSGSDPKGTSKTVESTNKQSGLWGNGSVAARDGGQWPLGSQAVSSSKP